MTDRYRAGKRLWSKRDDALMRKRYPHESTKALAKELRRSISSLYARADKLGLKKTEKYLASADACRLRRGDNPGVKYRFAKGHVPANKGLRRPGYGPGRMKETQFKAGQRGSRWVPIGSTRVIDGYQYTKTSDIRSSHRGAGFVPWTRNWKLTHIILWEQTHGPLPKGHAIVFKNGDRTDIRIENLECVTRRELMARNTVHNLPKELVGVIQLFGALKRQINKRTKGNEKQDR